LSQAGLINATQDQGLSIAEARNFRAPQYGTATVPSGGEGMSLEEARNFRPATPLSPPTSPADADDGFFKTTGKALIRGAVEGATDIGEAPTAFEDRPTDEQDNSHLGKILATPVSEGWSSPTWWAAHIAHDVASAAPSLALGLAGGAAGAATAGALTAETGPGAIAAAAAGGLAGSAAGFGLGSGLSELKPAYLKARADGLDHDEAVSRAMVESGIAGAFGSVMGLAPGMSFFGKTVESALKKPISEALAQTFGVMPAVGAAQQVTQGAVEGKLPTAGELATGYAENVGVGAALVGIHSALGVVRKTPADKIADDVTDPNIDLNTAIDTAAQAAKGETPAAESIVAGKDALDAAAAQSKISTLFKGMNTGTAEQTDNGTVNYTPKGSDIAMPMEVRDPSQEPEDGNGVSSSLAQKVTDHYQDEHGVNVVWVKDPGKNVPFDGAVDPNQPNTIFLSDNPDRAITGVVTHEFGHLMENIRAPDTKLPDTIGPDGETIPGAIKPGERFGDLLNETVLKNMNSTAWDQAIEIFSPSAPKRGAVDDNGAPVYAPGGEGDADHAQDMAVHFVNEFAKDTIGDVQKNPALEQLVLGKVADLAEERYGPEVAQTMMTKFMDGIKAAMQTVRDLFSADKNTASLSESRFNNLAEVHDVVASMLAHKYFERFGDEPAPVDDVANRDSFLKAGTPSPATVTADTNHPLGPAYIDARTKAASYARWLGQLDAKRREDAKTSEPVRVLQQARDAILNKVGGVEDRLTKTGAARLADIRSQLDARLNPVGDNADMANVRAAMVREHQRMADAASVSKGPQFSPKQRDEDNKPFFSALQRGVEDLKMDKAPPGQWEATIKNLPGIKSEEIAWSGLNEFLRGQTRPVTKTEVLQHLRDNDVQINEVVKGNTISAEDEEEHAEIKQRYRYDPDSVSQADYDRMVDLEKRAYNSEGQTKFSTYALPGGENYREMLMTLPPTVREIPAWKAVRHDGQVDSTYDNELAARDRASAIGGTVERGKTIRAEGGFKSSHFDEPNILAHARFDDRTTADGKKDLHVAEIQSDWHQKGRREGYAKDQPQFWVRNTRSGNASPFFNTLEEADAYRNKLPEAVRGQTIISKRPGKVGTVPDAPFKTTWHELAMKRMLRYAAENGYDRLSWDTGETQADRYDLSHQVDSIGYRKDGDNTYEVSAIKDGESVMSEHGQTPAQLENIVGKDAAKKIVDGEGTPRAGGGNVKDLSGLDLKVGGEGMKGFYDKILPNFVNKYVKKWNGKVERTTFEADANRKEFDQVPYIESGDTPVHSVAITPEMRKSVMRGQPKFSPRKIEEPTEGKPVPKDVALASGLKNSNKAVLNDSALSEAEKRGRLISDRRINAALAKEANGRPADAQSGLSGPDAGKGSGRLDTGGFTDSEKRAFARASAAQDVRSARLGGEPSSFSFERKSSGDGGKSRVLKSLGVTYDAEWKAGAGLRRVYEKNGSKVPLRILELTPGDDKNAARFEQAITASKNSSKDGAAVAVYPVEDYKNFKLLMSDDGKSGAAVKPDGDIISVFSNNGTGHAMFEAAIAAGGRKLDAFDTILPDFYHSHGFIEAARTAWNDEFAPEGWDKAHFAEFNNGKPDVVLMVLDRGNVSPVLEKSKVFSDWDGAARVQEKLLKKMDREQPAATINLRLDRLDGKKPFTVAQAKAELAKFGVDAVATRTRKINGKEGEPGVVMNLSRALTPEEATRFSEAMKQEAIPQFANGRGELHGPNAEKWGDFNPEKFHPMQEGQALHSPRVSSETRDALIRKYPDLAQMFRRPAKISEEPVTPEKVETPAFEKEHVGSLEEELAKAGLSGADKTAPAAETPKQRAITMQNPEGNGKPIQRALNDEETRALENAPQIEAASKLVDMNKDRAIRIAMRKEQPPKDLLPTFVYFELERRALAEGDDELQAKLRTSPLAKEVTTAGRLGQSFVTRDPVAAAVDAHIQVVENARTAALKAKGGDVVKVQAKAEKEVAEQMVAAKRQARALSPREKWAQTIAKITCAT
jgi:hypothetical protein